MWGDNLKIDWNRKYTTIAAYVVILMFLGALFFALTTNWGVVRSTLNKNAAVFQPFLYGISLAYMLNFILKFFENKILSRYKKLTSRQSRVIGLLLTYLTIGIILYLFVIFVLPQLSESFMGLVNDIPTYIYKGGIFINNYIQDLELDDQIMNNLLAQWNKIVNNSIQFLTNLIPLFASTVRVVAASIWNLVIGFIVSIYILSDKERFYGISKKIVYALFRQKRAHRIFELSNRSNKIFGNFLVGKIIDSLIIGVLTFIILTVIKMPYNLLISVIIGVTNIIPFFGPFIGAVPSILIVLFVSPIKALWLAVAVFVIQQIDGNIIGPKILGESIGISAFWILFSLLVGGKLFGIPGLVIGVPLFAIVYSIIKDAIESRLAKKGLQVETIYYYDKDLKYYDDEK